MSTRAANWVLGHSETESALRLILLVLAHNADSIDGSGSMRLRTVAKQSGLPVESVEKGLGMLAIKGELQPLQITVPNRRIRRMVRYRVPVPQDYYPEMIQQGRNGGRP